MSKNKETQLSWNDITLDQFIQLSKTSDIKDDTEKMLAIGEIVYGDGINDLSIPEFSKKMNQLGFLSQEIPTSVPPKKVVLNGRKYFTDCLLGNITTAQYIDFQNHMKSTSDGKEANILSVFIIPEGHKYNDGYDMLEVINDIKSMPMPVVMSISFFFGRQFSVFMRIFQRYSKKRIQDLKLPKEMKEAMKGVVDSSVDLALYPLSSPSAK